MNKDYLLSLEEHFPQGPMCHRKITFSRGRLQNAKPWAKLPWSPLEIDPHSLVIFFYNFLPLSEGRACDLLLPREYGKGNEMSLLCLFHFISSILLVDMLWDFLSFWLWRSKWQCQEVHMSRSCRWPPAKASKKLGPQSQSFKEMNSVNNWTELVSGPFPSRASRWEHSPGQHLGWNLENPIQLWLD